MRRRAVRWTLLSIAITAALVGTSCALRTGGGPAPPITVDQYAESDKRMEKDGFRVMTDAAGSSRPATFNRIQRVYVRGSGPKVILLHELPGLSDGDIQLGVALSKDFEVHVPLLFGVAGQYDSGLGKRQTCKAGLFKCNDRNVQHPITTDLLAMANYMCDKAECGVIGMCLTGSVPLYLMPAKGVVALVIAQPTLPFFWHIWPFAGLDISEKDTRAAMDLAEQRAASIYMVRYRHDWISGHAAFNRLVKRIEPSKSKLSFFAATEVATNGHSTLVHNTEHPEVAKQQIDAVVKALNARLRRRLPTSTGASR